MVSRLNLFLLLAVIASSVYLVRVSYETRRLFAELDRAQGEERQLDSALEKAARDKLAMRSATPAVTQYVVYGRAASAAEGRLP